MQELTVIRAERDRLIVATEAGDTFALPITDALRAEVRRVRPAPPETNAAKPRPREVQAHIRAGLSAEEVAALLDARLEDVQRYEAPVLAEREHILGLALAVPVLLAAVDDAEARPTFGEAIRAKLAEAGAIAERWTSWKEPESWLVKVEFRIGDVDHDARWTFDPKRSALAPQNADATQLSRQGSLPEGLIPRLRALDSAVSIKDESRFDSGAFGPRHEPEADAPAPEAPRTSAPAAADAAIKRAPDAPVTSAETADLLEALRRRRGQREPAPGAGAQTEHAPSPIALFDALEPGFEEVGVEAPAEVAHEQSAVAESGQRRRGRAALPSWDEIVFGARGDND